MAHTHVLQRRIRSVRNAKQITKAMEVVAASRLRRIAEATHRAQAYSDATLNIMRRAASTQEARSHPYFQANSAEGSRLFIIITSDRGLAGAFNANVHNQALKGLEEERRLGRIPYLVVLGSKGARYFARFAGINLIGVYENVDENPEANVFAPIIRSIEAGFENNDFSAVSLIYTRFISTLNQQVQITQLLPVSLPESEESQDTAVYDFEPDVDAVLHRALSLYFESQLITARIDSAASEYAMRMVAMGNANRNAGDLIDNLTLELNASRQAAITQEIAEITGGAEAVA